MPIPEFDEATGYLPPGDHEATLEEVVERFATNYRRRVIASGLRRVVSQLRDQGVTTIWIDGSYTTDEPRPQDVDVIYDPPANSDPHTWGDIAPRYHKRVKDRERVDLWPHPSPQPSKTNPLSAIPLHDWMATDRDNTPKGMILLQEETQSD